MTTGYIGKDRADECCAPFGQEELCALLAELRAMRDRIDQMVITVQHVTVDGTGNVQLPFQEEIGDPDFGNAGSFAGAKSVKDVKDIADDAKTIAEASMEANTDALLTLEQSADADGVTVTGKNITGEVKTTVELPAVDAAHAGVMTPAKMDEIAEEMDRHALDNAVVHKTGDTMTGTLYVPELDVKCGNEAVFYLINTAKPSDNIQNWGRYGWIRIRGKDGDTGEVVNTADANGTYVTMRAIRKVGDSNKNSAISVKIDKNGNASTTAPTPSDANDKSDKIATTDWVYNCSHVVHTFGSEEIAGTKTFKNNPFINAGADSVLYINDNNDPRDPQSWRRFGRIIFSGKYDNNTKALPTCEILCDGDKNTSASTITVKRYKSDGTLLKSANLGVRVRSNGYTYAIAPTPASNASGEEIATTGWVRSLLQSAGIQVTRADLERTYAPVMAAGLRAMEDPEHAEEPQIGEGLTLDTAAQVHVPVLSQPDPEPPYGFDN